MKSYQQKDAIFIAGARSDGAYLQVIDEKDILKIPFVSAIHGDVFVKGHFDKNGPFYPEFIYELPKEVGESFFITDNEKEYFLLSPKDILGKQRHQDGEIMITFELEEKTTCLKYPEKNSPLFLIFQINEKNISHGVPFLYGTLLQ